MYILEINTYISASTVLHSVGHVYPTLANINKYLVDYAIVTCAHLLKPQNACRRWNSIINYNPIIEHLARLMLGFKVRLPITHTINNRRFLFALPSVIADLFYMILYNCKCHYLLFDGGFELFDWTWQFAVSPKQSLFAHYEIFGCSSFKKGLANLSVADNHKYHIDCGQKCACRIESATLNALCNITWFNKMTE